LLGGGRGGRDLRRLANAGELAEGPRLAYYETVAAGRAAAGLLAFPAEDD